MLKAIFIIGIIVVGSVLFGLGVYVGHSKNDTEKENSKDTDLCIPQTLAEQILEDYLELQAAKKAVTVKDIKEKHYEIK